MTRTARRPLIKAQRRKMLDENPFVQMGKR